MNMLLLHTIIIEFVELETLDELVKSWEARRLSLDLDHSENQINRTVSNLEQGKSENGMNFYFRPDTPDMFSKNNKTINTIKCVIKFGNEYIQICLDVI